MNPPGPICILLCVDNTYLPQAGIAVFSLVDSNPDVAFDIHVAAFDRDHALSAAVFKPAQDHHPGCSIKYIDLNNSLFADLPVTGQFSKSMYTRLIVGRLIDPGYARVLYFDADIIVREKISRLYEVALDGAVLAAVRDPFNICGSAIGFSPEDPYFNSGVLLIDMDRWRQENCEARLLAHLHAHRSSPWMDQDALNVVLRGRVKFIGLEWNYQPRCADVPAAFLGLDARTYAALRGSPSIVHFTTSLKPWTAAYRIHYSDRYFEFVGRAGLKTYVRRPRPTSPGAILAAAKTKLRWHFPRAFRAVRRRMRPEAAAAMYRADQHGRMMSFNSSSAHSSPGRPSGSGTFSG